MENFNLVAALAFFYSINFLIKGLNKFSNYWKLHFFSI